MCIPRFAREGTRAGPSHMANAADRESFSGSPLAARRYIRSQRPHSSSIKLFRDGFGVSFGVSIPVGPN